MKKTDASPSDFTGWFEREEALIRSACETLQVHCTRATRTTMDIAQATIDLVQLRRALDHRSEDDAAMVVHAWVDKAISMLTTESSQAVLSMVFPHLRSPQDRSTVPWIEAIANDRLLCCLIADEPDSMRYLSPIDTMAFDRPIHQVIERAMCNLSLLPPYGVAACAEHPIGPDVWVIQTGDGHDAARLLIADILVGGPAIGWLPHRDRLILTKANLTSCVQWAGPLRREAIQHAQHAKHPITAEAFLVQNSTITHLPFHCDGSSGRLYLPTDGINLPDAPP